MKKTICLTMLAVLLTGALWAKPVSENSARRIGAAYLTAMGHPDATRLTPVETGFTEFYVFSASNGGFVLVSADDCVRPILGYSLTGTFPTENMPTNVRGWLEDYANEIAHVKEAMKQEQQGRLSHNPQADPVAAAWQQLALGSVPEPQVLTSVSPLLTTTWSQSPLYNDLCPYDSDYDQRVVTGCVATATAQIMKYWNHPATGYGSHSYTASNSHTSYGTLSADFGNTSYAWTSMPNALTSISSQTEINAVATLIYHVGVAVEMRYNVSSEGGSGAYNHSAYYPSAMSALINYFKYSPDIVVLGRNGENDSFYCAQLRAELDQSRPILYDGRSSDGGHSFVCDGYDQNNYFHFNWGWGGSYDGYFAMGALNPSYSFNASNTAMLGIRPSTNFGTGGTITVNTTGGNATCSATGGGTYAFGDTVTLTAVAGEGYRFAGWSDNSTDNPRIFNMTGGNYSFTARFETLGTDTMSYCGNMGHYSSWGEYEEGFEKYWGIKLPASSLTAGQTLTAVDFYVGDYYDGNFDLTVYTGTTGPTEPVYSTSVWVDYVDRDSWYSIYLPTAYTVEAGKSLWLTFHNSSITFPAAISSSCGNPDGFLYGPAFNPDPQWNLYTFMIRGRFSNPGIIAQGDTISYCGNKPYYTDWSCDQWGIMIPAADLAGRNYLKSVKLFADFSGIYTLKVYKGGSTFPGTLVHTQPANITTYGWQEIELDNLVTLDATNNLWITFSCPDVLWPAASCRYAGNPNSHWINYGNDWNQLSSDFSWMIKAVTSTTAPTLPPPTVAIVGDRHVGIGSPSTFTAAHSTGTTVTWSIQDGTPSTASGDAVTVSWSQTGWHLVSATVTNSNGSSTDEFWVNTVDCDQAVTAFPYIMDFEATDNMVCLHTLDVDNDGSGWGSDYYNWYRSLRSYRSQGWTWANDNYQTLAMDNWLILPKMTTHPEAGYSMEWYDMAEWMEAGSHAHYGVYIDTTAGTNTANYVLLAEYTTEDTWFTQKSLDLSAYAGKTFRLAFRHYNNGGLSSLYLDYIKVNENISFFREGDTISYCGWRNVQSNLGYNSGNTYWGIKFEPSRLAGCDTLKSVLLYVAYDGNYTLNIAQEGTDAPGTPLRTVDVVFNGQYGWQEIPLTPAVPLNSIQPLWITFYSTAYYPAIYTQNSGDPNSDWISGNGINWFHCSNYNYDISWMIKAVTSGTEGCSNIQLPYSADFTQCWHVSNGATIVDSTRVSINSPGQTLVSPWFEIPSATKVFINYDVNRDTTSNEWYIPVDSDAELSVIIEDENGEFYSWGDWLIYNHEERNGSFRCNGGHIRFVFRYPDNMAAVPLLYIENLRIYAYDINLSIAMPNIIRVGDTVDIVSHLQMEGNDTPDYRQMWTYREFDPWGEVDSTNCTILALTDSSRTVVWHMPGMYSVSASASKDFFPYYVYADDWKSFTVYDTVTIDCDNISLPYTADFTQCWQAENGATIIDPSRASITSYGQKITSPWMQSVPGMTFFVFGIEHEGNPTWNNERVLFTVESENGVIMNWEETPWNGTGSQIFDSPGGRIRVSMEYVGNNDLPSLRFQDVMLYQYQIDVSLDMPGMVQVGDTVTIAAHATMQNGDTPDYYSFYTYDNNGYWMDDNNPARTIISSTDSSMTMVWNTPGVYEVGVNIGKYNVYQGWSAYAYSYGNLNVVNHSFYEQDSIYYTSAAKDTVIGCHSQLHIADLPASVRVINDSSFYQLPNLSTVNLPDGLTHIGHRAFYNNSNLTEITIPRNVQFIGDNAFCANYSLTTVYYNAENCQTVSPTTESNGSYWPAFINCPNINTIHIAPYVKRIPDRIFWGCYGLRGTLIIPDSVTYIGYDAFTGWNNDWAGGDDTLSIVIGKGVNKIGNYAFGMPFGKLTSVISRNPEPPTITSNTFYVQQDLTTLTVPCGSKPAYQAASYWIEFLIVNENCNGMEDVETADGLNVYCVAGSIVVNGATGQKVDFYDVSGRLLHRVECGGETITFHPSGSGVYLVRTGNVTRRVVVVR